MKRRVFAGLVNAMSPSMIVALIALFVALGGAAYAVDHVPVNGRHNAGSSRLVATGIAANPGVGQTTVVNRAAPQAITSGSLTSVSWDSERQDDGGWFTLGTPDRITVTVTGVYIVTFNGSWSSGPATSFVASDVFFHHLERIRASDGIQEVLGAAQALDPHDASSASIAWCGVLLANDAIRIRVEQATGATQNFGGKNRVSGNPITDSSNAELSVTRLA
jgi:hypothetical protein